MTTRLDYCDRAPGYYAGSAWPVECGGNRRQKLVGGAPAAAAAGDVPVPTGLGLAHGERLRSITRHTGGWAVMFVQRGTGELYLQCGAGMGAGELPPVLRRGGDSSGWLEKVDPTTLQTLCRSPPLPSGGHLWCGAAVAHANGDLYMVNGRYCHRLSPDCEVVAERQLPIDGAYNGVMVLSDGKLIMKNLGTSKDQPCQFCVLDPDTLDDACAPLDIGSPGMGRFSADVTVEGEEFVYFTTDTEVKRLRYRGGALTLDASWGPGRYALEGEDQSAGWDTCLGSGSIWMMDMGRPPNWGMNRALGAVAIGLKKLGSMGVPGTKVLGNSALRSAMVTAAAPQRAFRFSLVDPVGSCDVVDAIGTPHAFNPGPPLYDPTRQILVHYDTIGRMVVAHKYHGPGALSFLWKQPFCNSVQMMLYPASGELVLEDSPHVLQQRDIDTGALVVVDIKTGEEKGRAPFGDKGTMGMFLCPGFGRDFYGCSIAGTVARVYVEEEAEQQEQVGRLAKL